MGELRIRVIGTPAPQGSKTSMPVRGSKRRVLVEASAGVKPWRQDVHAAAVQVAQHAGWQPPGSVLVEVTYLFRRPRHHYRTGKFSHELRPGAPTYHSQKPDLDKLVRSTLDALTSAGVLRDDSNVVRLVTDKVWARADQATGAAIRVTEFPSTQQGEAA